MSQTELHNAWESICAVIEMVVPLFLVSGIVSICNFFQRHWGVEPFVLSKLLIGVGTDIVYGSLVGLATIGSGQSHCLAWALAGFAVHVGLRNVERMVRRIVCKRYGVDDDEEE